LCKTEREKEKEGELGKQEIDATQEWGLTLCKKEESWQWGGADERGVGERERERRRLRDGEMERRRGGEAERRG